MNTRSVIVSFVVVFSLTACAADDTYLDDTQPAPAPSTGNCATPGEEKSCRCDNGDYGLQYCTNNHTLSDCICEPDGTGGTPNTGGSGGTCGTPSCGGTGGSGGTPVTGGSGGAPQPNGMTRVNPVHWGTRFGAVETYVWWKSKPWNGVPDCTTSDEPAECEVNVPALELDTVCFAAMVGSVDKNGTMVEKWWGDGSGDPPAPLVTHAEAAAIHDTTVGMIGNMSPYVDDMAWPMYVCQTQNGQPPQGGWYMGCLGPCP